MTTRDRRIWAAAAVGLLLLAGCAARLSSAATDACNIHAAWDSAGQPDDRRSGMVRSLAATGIPADESGISSAVSRLTVALQDQDDDAFSRASADLAAACRARMGTPRRLAVLRGETTTARPAGQPRQCDLDRARGDQATNVNSH